MGIFDKFFRQTTDKTDSMDQIDSMKSKFDKYTYDDETDFFDSNKEIFFQGNHVNGSRGRYLIYSVHRTISLDYENKKEIESSNSL